MCPLTSTQGERLCPPLFEHLGVVERIVDDIAIFVGQIVIFPKWRGRPCSSRSLVRIFRSLPSDNWSRKRAGSEYGRRFPQFKPKALIRNEVARPHHFIPLQTPEAFRNAGSRGCFWFARLLRWFRQAVHCHLVRNASISAGSAFVGI